MQSHRLARLLRIIIEIRSYPQKKPEQIADELNISLRQFYYDRNALAEMGFRFKRVKGRFKIIHDPVVTISRLPLSEILAWVLTTRHLFASKDFSVVRQALDSLIQLVDHMPESKGTLMKSLIQDVIIQDGFGCSPEILEDVTSAVDGKQRILVHFNALVQKKPMALDPLGFSFKQSKLFLDAYAVSQKKRKQYPLSTMEKIVFTPLYCPEDAQPPSP